MNRIISSHPALPAASALQSSAGFVSPASASSLITGFRNMSSAALKNVSHVIFDMDGLLLDTEPIYTVIFQEIIEPFGHNYTWDVKLKLMGTQAEQTARLMVSEYNLPMTWQEFAAQCKSKVMQKMGDVPMLAGAKRLLRHLHANNVPFALATSSGQEMAELKMSKHSEVFSLFHHKVFGTTDPEVIVGKPAPDIFLVAAQRFPDKPDPSKCLVFEDAPNGVRAATLAGMQSVMVPDDHVAEELRKEATVVIRSLLEFRPELFGLPPFTDNDLEN